jgi:arylsulfatase A-like enzyme
MNRAMANNVILITVVQWRGDCLSIKSHPAVHTPGLDRIALVCASTALLRV